MKKILDEVRVGNTVLQLTKGKGDIPAYGLRYRNILPIFDAIFGLFYWKYVFTCITHENAAVKKFNQCKDDLIENNQWSLSKR